MDEFPVHDVAVVLINTDLNRKRNLKILVKSRNTSIHLFYFE